MLDAALYAALGVAACSALWGSRAAWVLLASVTFCLALNEARVPFHPILWMLFDLVVVLLIVRPKMTHADCVILALFIPAWVFYLMPQDDRYFGSMLVTIAQLFLTAPIERVRFIPARARAWFGRDDAFDRFVAHGRLAGV